MAENNTITKSGFAKAIAAPLKAMREHGREVERSLQLVSGTCFITLLAALSATWTDLFSPIGKLRLAYIGALITLSYAFAMAFMASAARVLSYIESKLDVPAPDSLTWGALWGAAAAKLVFPVLWVVMIATSIVQISAFGHDLVTDLIAANSKEITDFKQQARDEQEKALAEQEERVAEMEANLKELEAMMRDKPGGITDEDQRVLDDLKRGQEEILRQGKNLKESLMEVD